MNRIEAEKKFYLKDSSEIKEYAKQIGFVELESLQENDEYFTDLDLEFVKNRTCLRIRTTNDKELETTFKGQSVNFSSDYIKLENNIPMDVTSYMALNDLFAFLGYVSYCNVAKKRTLLSKRVEGYIYNIALDEISAIGSFVEFEVLAKSSITDLDKVRSELNNLVGQFSSFALQEADEPYRDFVANALFDKFCPNGDVECVLSDLDGTLIDSEYLFYEATRNVLYGKYNINITFDDYVANENEKNQNLVAYLKEKSLLDENIDENDVFGAIYKEYDQLFPQVLKGKTMEINFCLLKMLKKRGVKLALVSTSKRYFINKLLTMMNIEDLFDVIVAREDVTCLKPSPEAYQKALSILKINKNKCLVLEDSLRGVQSSIDAGINTVLVEDYCQHKQYNQEIENKITRVSKLTNVILILLNYLKR